MLKLNSINKKFNDKVIFKDFTYSFNDIGFYIIKGKSGIGKSTLLNIISSLTKIDSGFIQYPNNINNIYKDISYIYQDNNLFENLNIIDNIKLVLDIKNEIYNEEKVLDVLKKLDIVNLKDYQVSNLSSGERQRVNIAISLIIDSKIILVDEGLANLDDSNKENILSILKLLSLDHLIILSTHDEYILNQFNDNIIDLNNLERYQLKNNDLLESRKDKKFNINILKSFLIDFKIIKKQKLRLIFTTLIFLAFFYLLSYSLCLKSFTKVKLVSNDIINNNIDGFVVTNLDNNDSKINDFDCNISSVSYVGLDTEEFDNYYKSNKGVVNHFIFDDTLNYSEIILTDYSINILKEEGLISYNNLSDCIGKILDLKLLDLTIKDIIITNYDSNELYFNENKDYYYYYGYISRETFTTLKQFPDYGSICINNISSARYETITNIKDDEIYMSDRLISKIFNTYTPSDYYNTSYTLTFKAELDSSISFEKEFIIRQANYDFEPICYEVSKNSEEEIYKGLRNLIPDNYFNYGYYVSKYKNVNALKKVLNYIYSNNGEISYKDYSKIYYTDYAISSYRKTFDILSYIILIVSIIFTSFMVYSMHIANKDNINKLKIYGLSNISLYKIFNIEFVIPILIAFIISLILTILSCNQFDINYLNGLNIHSFNFGIIILVLFINLIIILLCNLLPFIIKNNKKKEEI